MSNVAREAIEVLKSGGWIQGSYAFEGRHCAIGAIVKAAHLEMDDQDLYQKNIFDDYADIDIDSKFLEIAREQYPERMLDEYVNIPAFNDHPDTTFEDIERVFEKVAVWIDEQA